MTQTIEEKNKAFVLEAFETLFNKRDYAAAERFWSPNYIQHSAHIPPGREGLFALVKGTPDGLHYENGLTVANGDYVLLHGRFSGMGLPANWIVVDIVRLENGRLAELPVIPTDRTEVIGRREKGDGKSKRKARMWRTVDLSPGWSRRFLLSLLPSPLSPLPAFANSPTCASTYSGHCAGRGTGPRSSGGAPPRAGAALDQGQSAARPTSPARTGLRST